MSLWKLEAGSLEEINFLPYSTVQYRYRYLSNVLHVPTLPGNYCVPYQCSLHVHNTQHTSHPTPTHRTLHPTVRVLLKDFKDYSPSLLLILHTMRGRPFSSRYALHLLKHWLPMKGLFVLVAPNGLGCDVLMTKCLLERVAPHSSANLCAPAPQHKKTKFSLSFANLDNAALVKVSHPFLRWL